MPENDKTDSVKTVKANKDEKNSQRGLWAIIGIGAVVFLIVIAVGSFLIDFQKIRFITEFSLTVVLATLIGVQAYIYKRQWDAMDSGLEETRKIVEQNERTIKATEKSVEVAEKTSIYAQRAYLSAKLEGRRGGYLFQLRIENSGSTPANKVEVWHSFGFLDQAPDGLDADFANHVPVGVIAPRTVHPIDVSFTKEITPERYSKEFQPHRKLKFYCWGAIWYEDIFQQRRRTAFAFHQQFEFGIGVPCASGNEAY